MNTRRTAHSQHGTSATRRSLLQTGAIGAVASVALPSPWRADAVGAFHPTLEIAAIADFREDKEMC